MTSILCKSLNFVLGYLKAEVCNERHANKKALKFKKLLDQRAITLKLPLHASILVIPRASESLCFLWLIK